MTQDGLAIGTSINQGEAQILPRSGFRDFSEKILHLADRERQEQKANEDRFAKLISKKTISKWQIDNAKHVQPKLDEWRKKGIEMFRETNGKKTDAIKWAEYEQEGSDIQTDVEAGNLVFPLFEKAKQAIMLDKKGEFKHTESLKNLERIDNPTEEDEKEIKSKYSGNRNAWRAAKIQTALVPTFNYDTYLGGLMKDEKLNQYVKSDEKGQIVYKQHPNGQQYYEEVTAYTPAQLESAAQKIINGESDADIEANAYAVEQLKDVSVLEGGNIGFPEGFPEKAKEFIIGDIGNKKGTTKKETYKHLVESFHKFNILQKGGAKVDPKELAFHPAEKETTEQKRSWRNNGGRWESDKFSMNEQDKIKNIPVKSTSKFGFPTLKAGVKVKKAFVPGTIAVGAVPPVMTVRGTGDKITPTLIMLGEDGKYYIEGSVPVQDMRSAAEKAATPIPDKTKVMTVLVDEAEIKAAFNLTDADLNEMFGTETRKGGTVAATTGTPKFTGLPPSGKF